MEIIKKANYTFKVTKDVTITPVVRKIPDSDFIEWPLGSYKDVTTGRDVLFLQRTFYIAFPSWVEYVNVTMPVYNNQPLVQLSVRSDKNITWYDNTKDANTPDTTIHVSTYIERSNSDDTSITYLLMLPTNAIVPTDAVKFGFSIGNTVNNYGRSLTSKDIISDIRTS